MKGPTPGHWQKISQICKEEAMKTPNLKRRRRLLNFAKTSAAIGKDKAKRQQ